MNFYCLFLFWFFFCSNLFYGATNIWEKEIAAFESSESLNMPEMGSVVFEGSSSIRGRRTFSKDLLNQNFLNKDFGGAA